MTRSQGNSIVRESFIEVVKHLSHDVKVGKVRVVEIDSRHKDPKVEIFHLYRQVLRIDFSVGLERPVDPVLGNGGDELLVGEGSDQAQNDQGQDSPCHRGVLRFFLISEHLARRENVNLLEHSHQL